MMGPPMGQVPMQMGGGPGGSYPYPGGPVAAPRNRTLLFIVIGAVIAVAIGVGLAFAL